MYVMMCIVLICVDVELISPLVPQPKKGKTSVIMMVGLQGAGKTTTCTKVSYLSLQQLVIHNKKPNHHIV